MRKIHKLRAGRTIAAIAFVFAAFSCNLDPKFYSLDTPDTFFTSPDNAYAVLARPYSHWRYNMGNDRWYLEVLTSDEMTCPTRGRHFYNQGEYERLQYHTWGPDDRFVENTYIAYTRGVSQCLESRAILEAADYPKMGLTEEEKQNHLQQLNALMAFFYKQLLFNFGGMPLYSDNMDSELRPRSSDLETFEFIENLLLEAMPYLRKKSSLGETNPGGYMNQGIAATILAQLYFNANVTIGKDMFTECEKICQDIIDGVYGPYALEPTWYASHSFDNDKSPEVIWAVPSANSILEDTWFTRYNYHFDAKSYFGVAFSNGLYNGFCLSPSRDPLGRLYSEAPYNHKLGVTFESFHDDDVRKKPYRYLGNKTHEGMFQMGSQVNPNDPTQATIGQEEYKNQIIVFRDQIARFSEVGTTYPNEQALISAMPYGEENSGFRLVKTPIPTAVDQDLLYEPDRTIYRLAEIYYMQAECKMRSSDTPGAAALINKVRARNFVGADPDPVTGQNLDMYRMLKEWMIEFLGEGHGRRRTDLIRWGQFIAGEWWDHTPHNDPNKNRFPIPTTALAANNKLVQNPGYSSAPN